MEKYLIVGLGNPEEEYAGTRHNIGFDIVNQLVKKHDATFHASRLAKIANFAFRGKLVYVIKPSTYMNLSGKAVRYWMEQVKPNDFMVICDDISLPLGKIRLRKKGGAGGHNGLESVIEWLGSEEFNRLRFGIGKNFERGRQVDYVLGKWNEEELKKLDERILIAVESIEAWMLSGMDFAMNHYNNY
ncbi:MAG: aminoacyl-tRNA hydrolase [Bacteroidales bacterium]|nr:aminoacyl-tRNA hydrolase [Bacteroidales bacterium]